MDLPSNKLPWRVDASNELGYDLKPDVDLYRLDSFDERFVDVLLVTVVEPQRQKPQRVLKGASLRQCNGAEKSLNSRLRVEMNISTRLKSQQIER